MIIRKDYLPLFKGIDLSQRRLPMLIADSGSKGPVFWITAAIHGDEVTGTAVVLSLFHKLKNNHLKRGILNSFPILNPSGFEAISRQDIFEEEDLNRHFDDNPNLSLSRVHAQKILNIILESDPNYVIDLHTDSQNSIAYTLIDQPQILTNKKVFLKSIGLSRSLGFDWAIDTDNNAGYALQKCLTGRLMTEGIPAVTVELGGPLYINEKFRTIGVDAIWSVLEQIGMVGKKDKSLDCSEPEYSNYFEQRIRAKTTGIVSYRVRPGNHVHKHEILAKIRNIFGETIEIIRSPVDAIVFSHEDQSICFPGQPLFTLAVERKFYF